MTSEEAVRQTSGSPGAAQTPPQGRSRVEQAELTREELERVEWPLTTRQYMALRGGSRYLAIQALSLLEGAGKLTQVWTGAYIAPGYPIPSFKGVPRLNSLEAWQTHLSTIRWPRTEEELKLYTDQPQQLTHWLARLCQPHGDQPPLLMVSAGAYVRYQAPRPNFVRRHFMQATRMAEEIGKGYLYASRVIDRARNRGQIHNIARGVYSVRRPLEQPFTAQEFAAFFLIAPEQAQQAAETHARGGELHTLADGRYEVTPEHLAQLIYAYAGWLPPTQGHKALEVLERYRPQLEQQGPLSVSEYAALTQQTDPKVRKQLTLLCQMNVMAREKSAANRCLYRLLPLPPLFGPVSERAQHFRRPHLINAELPPLK